MMSSHPAARRQPLDAVPDWFFSWGGSVLLAGLMVSRRPAAVLHPQFWAEDGQIFYHDAYMSGAATLWAPLGGYLNTASRLVALLATPFPLAWAPALFVCFSFAAQIWPIWLLLSPRLAPALPSRPAALALACFYAAEPNSFQLNLILTNAQWHLAMAVFLLIAARPPHSRLAQGAELSLVALSGLSGPFGLFLVPIAWFEYRRRRAATVLWQAIILSATALVQLAFIVLLHGAAGRANQPLDASLGTLMSIMTNHIWLGGLIGRHAMHACLANPAFSSLWIDFAVTVMGGLIVAAAWQRGPHLLRTAMFWAGAMFAASMATPLALSWSAMAKPGTGLRYFAIPSLVWFAALLTLHKAREPLLRLTSRVLLGASLWGVITDWPYPAFMPTNFTSQARAFATAPAGAVFVFPENPPGWAMVLTKRGATPDPRPAASP